MTTPNPNPYPGPYPPPQPPPRGAVKPWVWIVVGVASTLFLLAIVGAVTQQRTATSTYAPATSAATSAPTASAPTAPVDPPAPAAAPATGPATSFGPGTHVVGTDIQPGQYKTAGPDPASPICYWAREKDTSGDSSALIVNGTPQGPTTVTIAKTDGAFETFGCQTWTKIG